MPDAQPIRNFVEFSDGQYLMSERSMSRTLPSVLTYLTVTALTDY